MVVRIWGLSVAASQPGGFNQAFDRALATRDIPQLDEMRTLTCPGQAETVFGHGPTSAPSYQGTAFYYCY